MSAKGRAPRTVHYMRMVLGLVFAQAKAEGRVGLNPASSLSVPALLTKSKRVLSSDEVKRLVAYKGTRFGPLFTFLLSTGLRVSEALALTEADISGSTVVVTRQLQWRTKGAWSLTVLKTSAARRTVPLSAMAKDAIQRAKDQVARDRKAAGDGYESFDLLFATESGKPSTQSNVHRALRSALDELKIPPASVHDLRRTFLTRLARVESRPQVLKSIAGHTSLSTTMQFYVTSNAEDEASAVSRAMVVVDLPFPFPPCIKHADLRALATEREDVMPPSRDGAPWPWMADYPRHPDRIVPQAPEEAGARWLERFDALYCARLAAA